jgi:high-affinity iron transporter
LICLIVGCGLIGAFYGFGRDSWGPAEYIYEGVFAIIASLIISLMGAALLRVSKMQEKWRLKLARALESKSNSITYHTAGQTFKERFKLYCERYAMFILPFITILREGLEAVIFIGGVSLALPASSIPLATVCGLLAGVAVGVVIYVGGNRAPLQLFLIVSTCFLYLVAAGLFSRAIWYLEANSWNKLTGGDAAETGSGAGSYDIRASVWHVNCCNPELNGGGGWGIFNALLGWQNSATYGSVIGYNLYWIVVILGFVLLRFREQKGHWPLVQAKQGRAQTDRKESGSDEASSEGLTIDEKGQPLSQKNPVSAV